MSPWQQGYDPNPSLALPEESGTWHPSLRVSEPFVTPPGPSRQEKLALNTKWGAAWHCFLAPYLLQEVPSRQLPSCPKQTPASGAPRVQNI